MPKFAANLSMMFNEVAFLDRFAAARDTGFAGVEFLFPYEHPVDVVAGRLRDAGLEIALFNLPPGNWGAGERGIASIPGREAEFRAGLEQALPYAAAMGAKRVHAMAGIPPAGADPAACRAALVANLRYAADKLAPLGIELMLEAINSRDMPGFFVSTQADSFSVCQEAGAPNLRMQMDIYHMQVAEGDIATKLRRYMPHCGHIQIAGAPDRHEPDTGEIRYEYLFRLIDELGYDGWVGCEYRPAGKTVDGLGWFKALAATA